MNLKQYLKCINGNVLYISALSVFLFQLNLHDMSWSSLFGYSKGGICFRFQILVMILLFLKVVLYQRTQPWRWAAAAGLAAVGIITYRIAGSSGNLIFWTTLFIACGQGIEVKDIAKTAFAVYLSMCIVTVCLAGIGILENKTMVRTEGDVLRWSMGYTHPNIFGLILLMICLSYCTMRHEKKPRSEFVLIGICMVLSQAVANSRTCTLLMGMLAVFLLMFHYIRSERLRTATRILFAAAAAFSVSFSVYFMFSYADTNTLFVRLNEILSNRLSLANMYYRTLSLQLFGMNVYDGTGITTFLVDNAYCHVLIRYGIVAFGVLIIGLVLFYADQIKRRRWDICLFGITLFMIMGVSENRTFEFGCNFFLIALAQLLFGRKERSDCGQRSEADQTGKK